MSNYKILVEFELDGVTFEKDVIVDDITEEAAATLIAEGKLVLVEDEQASDTEESAGATDGAEGNEDTDQHA